MSDSVKADKLFDPYEFTGVLMPGAIFLVGLGLFVILADVAGHLVLSHGGLIEFLWWRPFGWPTAQILKPDQRLLSKGQRSDLERQVHSKLALKDPFRIADLTPQEWSPITRQIYVAVAAASRSSPRRCVQRHLRLEPRSCSCVFCALRRDVDSKSSQLALRTWIGARSRSFALSYA